MRLSYTDIVLNYLFFLNWVLVLDQPLMEPSFTVSCNLDSGEPA
jgi:hypothetical protein